MPLFKSVLEKKKKKKLRNDIHSILYAKHEVKRNKKERNNSKLRC